MIKTVVQLIIFRVTMLGFMSSIKLGGTLQGSGLQQRLLSGVVLGLGLWFGDDGELELLLDTRTTLDQSIGFSSTPMSCRLCPIR